MALETGGEQVKKWQEIKESAKKSVTSLSTKDAKSVEMSSTEKSVKLLGDLQENFDINLREDPNPNISKLLHNLDQKGVGARDALYNILKGQGFNVEKDDTVINVIKFWDTQYSMEDRIRAEGPPASAKPLVVALSNAWVRVNWWNMEGEKRDLSS